MSRVRYYCAMSLEGFIAEADDTLGWQLDYDGSYHAADEERGGYERFYEDVGALVMGSTTYEWVLVHVEEWPYAGKPTWVLSSRALAPPASQPADVRIVAAEAPKLIDELRAAAAPVTSGSSAAATLPRSSPTTA